MINYLYRAISILLVLAMTYINWYRYHTPFWVNDLPMFDIWTLYSIIVLSVIAIFKPRNIVSEAFVLFNIVQALESVYNEYNKMTQSITQSDDNFLIFSIGISLAFIVTRFVLQNKLPKFLNKLPVI